MYIQASGKTTEQIRATTTVHCTYTPHTFRPKTNNHTRPNQLKAYKSFTAMNTKSAQERIEGKTFDREEGFTTMRDTFSIDATNALHQITKESTWPGERETKLTNMNKNGDWGGGRETPEATINCNGNDAFSMIGQSCKILDRSTY